MGAKHFLGGLALASVMAIGLVYLSSRDTKQMPDIKEVQSGYVATSDVKIEHKNLDQREQLPETYINIEGKSYVLIFDEQRRPVISEYKHESARITPIKPEEIKPEYAEYTGKLSDYRVIADNYKKGELLLHLDAKKEGTVPYAVTGHDYAPFGNWDRIFIRERQRDGYNSVLFKDGKKIWEPCNADKGRVKVPTPKQLSEARALLNEALEKKVNKK